jgi:hypothetical protein
MVYSRSKIVLFASVIVGASIGIAAITSISSTVKATDAQKPENKPLGTVQQKKAPETPTGVKFDLIGVVDSKGIDDRHTARLVDHLWSPKGEPVFGMAIRSDECISRNLLEKSKDPNTRYLIIGVTLPGSESLDILETVSEQPGSPHFEDDMPKPPPYRYDTVGTRTVDRRAYYIAKTTVDDLKNGYQLTYAPGPWKEEATISNLPKSNHPTTVLEKNWGKVTFKASATMPKYTVSLWREAKKDDPLIYPQFTLENNRPNEVEARLVYYFKGSNKPEVYLMPRNLIDDIEKVVVETRQCEHFDFNNIAANPDPAKWKDIYWADQGRSSVIPVGSCGTLEGIRYMGTFFAPNGKNWRDYSTEFRFFWMSEHPESLQDNPTFTYEPVIKIDPNFRAKERTVRIAGYLADSPTPGQVLGDKVCDAFWNKAAFGDIEMRFKRTENRKYIQFKVELAEENWQVIGSAKPIDANIVQADQKYLDSIRHDGMTNEAWFEIRFDPKGHFGWIYKRQGLNKKGDIAKPNLVNWTPGDYDYQVVMLLKSGKSVVYKLTTNGTGYIETRDFGPDRLFNLSAPFDGNMVQLLDIVSFRVEKRSFQKPFFVVATLPNVPHLDMSSTASMERQWIAYRDWEAQMNKSRGVPTTRLFPTTRPK